jgi:hypothetical protein
MKKTLKGISLLLAALLCMTASSVFAAEKNKTLIQCDVTKSAIEAAAGKVVGNKEAAADLEKARAAIKNAEECYNAGRPMFGFGDISPETEKEVKIAVDIADIATKTALSRVEFVRATAELEAIEKQFAVVKAKLKLFEDRKAELDRLRLEAAACRKIGNELEIIKLEKANLASQIDQLNAERGRADKLKIEQLELARKLDEMKAENSRLSTLLEKQQAEIKAVPDPAHEDAKKKSTKKP